MLGLLQMLLWYIHACIAERGLVSHSALLFGTKGQGKATRIAVVVRMSLAMMGC